jgi:hypothetical protein
MQEVRAGLPECGDTVHVCAAATQSAGGAGRHHTTGWEAERIPDFRGIARLITIYA